MQSRAYYIFLFLALLSFVGGVALLVLESVPGAIAMALVGLLCVICSLAEIRR
jgi:hypothetical protein